MLSAFIVANRDQLIQACDARDAARTGVRIGERGVGTFLDQLVHELNRDPPSTENSAILAIAAKNGRRLLAKQYTMSQVVHGYGDVCQAVTELAVERQEPIATNEFGLFNRCLDDAIAGAVMAYGRQRDVAIDKHANGQQAELLDIVKNLRVAIHTASTALEAVQTGSIGVTGSTGHLLATTVSAAHSLIDTLVERVQTRPPQRNRKTPARRAPSHKHQTRKPS